MMVPIAAVLFALGYVMQAGLINPFINRPEHSQFMLLVAIAIIMVNVLLIDLRAGRPQRADVLRVRQLRDRPADRRRHQGSMPAAPRSWSRPRCSRSSASRRIGKAIRACADNYTGALVVGLNVKRLYALTFGLGAACVGAAGAMLVLIIDVTPPLGPAYTLLAFIIVITGGLGSMPGALLGGVLIGVTEAMAGLLFTPSAKSMFAFAILVLVLLFRPQGILGKRRA